MFRDSAYLGCLSYEGHRQAGDLQSNFISSDEIRLMGFKLAPIINASCWAWEGAKAADADAAAALALFGSQSPIS